MKLNGKSTAASSFRLTLCMAALCMFASPASAQQKPESATDAPPTEQARSKGNAVASRPGKAAKLPKTKKRAKARPKAKPKARPKAKPKPPRELLLLKRGGNYPVQVAPATHTFVDFPGEIHDHTWAVDHPYFKIKKVRPTRLRIVPAPSVPMDTRLDIAVDFTVDNVTFNLQVGEEPQADRQIHVYLANIAALNALAVKAAQPEVKKAEERADKAEERADKAEENAENEKLRLQSQALINQINDLPYCQKPLYPIFETHQNANSSGVTWRLLESCWDEAKVHLLVGFEVENGDVRPFRAMRTVIVTDKQRKQYPAHITFIDETARPGTQPRPTSTTPGITAGEPADPNTDAKNAGSQDEPPADPPPVPLGAEIGIQQTVRGVIAIRLDKAPSVDQLRIRLVEPHSDPDQLRYLQAQVSSWSLHRPNVAPYTADDWALEVARREARAARATQLILGPSGSAGACWLSDGQDETNLDATNCFVFGMRLTKGITELVAFEVEAIGGWTGNTEFGEQTRSARFGRVTLAGVLRFGQFTIPYARFGVGAQGASYDDGSSTEFTPLTTFGIGLARRVGDNFVAGVGVSAVTEGFERLQTLDIGVHFGYGWNP